MDTKNIFQIEENTFDTLIKAAGACGYQQGVKDSLRAGRLGLGIVLIGLLGAVIVDALVEKYKERKQSNEISK